MNGSDYLPVAIRAYAERDAGKKWERKGKPQERWRPPRYLLVLDTETTVDRSQRLLFGSYRFFQLSWQTEPPYERRLSGWEAGPPYLACLEEGLLYADELPGRDPDGFRLLEHYARAHPQAVDREHPHAAFGTLRLRSRREFLERVFARSACGARAVVCCFNWPFDISRLAVGWAERLREPGAGGFALELFQYQDKKTGALLPDKYKPRIAIKQIDSKRALKSLLTPRDPDADQLNEDRHYFRGHLLDLRTLAFALTDKGHTLQSACAAFGVPYRKRPVEHGQIKPEYLDYNREDVAATASLYQALMAEYRRHPIALQATRAYSPASIGKAYLRALGITPILDRGAFPQEVLGYAMSAYFGGRAECRIRRVPVPVRYLDFASMYPTVCSLLELSELLTAGRIDVVEDDPEAVAQWLASISADRVFEKATWPKLRAIALVQPDGDVLPVRARYAPGGDFGIGINPLHSREPLWYSLPDLLASVLLTGRVPKILRVLRFTPHGSLRGLRPVRLRGQIRVDPIRRDLFRAAVEARRARVDSLSDDEEATRDPLARFLKTLANATSYGIFAEQVRHELPGTARERVNVFGLSSFACQVTAPEQAGEYFFSPLACLITGAARLMLALLERCVSDAGGAYAFCDTDSMAIVASTQGGLIPCPGGPQRPPDRRAAVHALSHGEVDRIIERFASLNPYNPAIVPGSILEQEAENLDPKTGKPRELYCYAISAKRYALYNLDAHGEPELRKWSEHGLGALLDPTNPHPEKQPEGEERDWIRNLWERIIRTDALGLPAEEEPAFLDRPALSALSISSPRLLRPLERLNETMTYVEHVKPFNFLLAAHVAPLGHPADADPTRFTLIAPYSRDHRQWRKLAWVNPYERGKGVYRITTGRRRESSSLVRVKSYRDVLDAYRVHPEPKSLGPDGEPCDRATIGLLKRRPVALASLTHVGKESNLLEDIQGGLVSDENEVLIEYRDPARDPFRTLAVEVLRALPVRQVATEAGLGLTTVKDTLRGAVKDPRKETRERLTAVAVKHARAQLREHGLEPPRGDLACLAAYLEAPERRAIPWEEVIAALREMRPPLDLPPRSYRHLLKTGARSKSREREVAAREAAVQAAVEALRSRGLAVPDRPTAIMRMYLDLSSR